MVMTGTNESFFIDKCSSMSSSELGEFIGMCFSYLENPQKHLDNLKKIPVLKETYEELLEKLESKLLGVEELVFCKNQLKKFQTLEIGKTTNTKFSDLEECYKKIGLETNNIIYEVSQTKHAVEEILLILLKILFSEVHLALIFVNSSEPYYKILELINDLSNLNKEVKQVISTYRIRDFNKLFINNFQSNTYDEQVNIFFVRSLHLPNILIHFRKQIGNSIKFNFFSLSETDRNKLLMKEKEILKFDRKNGLIITKKILLKEVYFTTLKNIITERHRICCVK